MHLNSTQLLYNIVDGDDIYIIDKNSLLYFVVLCCIKNVSYMHSDVEILLFLVDSEITLAAIEKNCHLFL